MAVITDRAQKYTGTSKKQDLYSDFLVNLNMHPNTNDLARVTNEDAVRKALRNLILTNVYERPFKPRLGCSLRHYLFEPISDITTANIRDAITSTIETYEPRAKLLQVDVVPFAEENAYNVSVVFYTINNPAPQTLQVSLYRVR